MNSYEYLSFSIKPKFTISNDGLTFPDKYRNDVKFWGNISREDIHSLNSDGTPKLLTMDVDFGDVCSLSCPGCFRRDNRVDKIDKTKLSDKQILNYIKEAKTLGLKSIKILGRGEPFENPNFLQFIQDVNNLDVGVGIFTKGIVLGDDCLAKKYNLKYGIHSSKELIQRLKNMQTSIYLNFSSFDSSVQDRKVGGKYKNYYRLRNSALINLCNAGFNDYVHEEPTRLALINAPFDSETLNEVYDIYTWGRIRNIYVVSCPTSLSGKGLDLYKNAVKQNYKDFIKKMEIEYSRIYSYAIINKIISLDSFLKDGPHIYAGAHPCNQIAAGFYLQLSGQIVQCPGRICDETIFVKNIRLSDLKTVWLTSTNGNLAKKGRRFNYNCVARDGVSLPSNFYNNIKVLTVKKLKDAKQL